MTDGMAHARLSPRARSASTWPQREALAEAGRCDGRILMVVDDLPPGAVRPDPEQLAERAFGGHEKRNSRPKPCSHAAEGNYDLVIVIA